MLKRGKIGGKTSLVRSILYERTSKNSDDTIARRADTSQWSDHTVTISVNQRIFCGEVSTF